MFKNAEFRGKADFAGAKFKTWSDFSNAVFNGKTMFTSADFADVDFLASEFKDETTFYNAQFNDSAKFVGTVFKSNVDFTNTVFCMDGNFQYAEFWKMTDFSKAEFKGKTDFSQAEFKEKVNFTEAVFLDLLVFNNTIYRNILGLDRSKYLFPCSEYRALTIQKNVYKQFDDTSNIETISVKSMRAKRKLYLTSVYRRYISIDRHFKKIICELWNNCVSEENSEGCKRNDRKDFDITYKIQSRHRHDNYQSLLSEFILYLKHLLTDHVDEYLKKYSTKENYGYPRRITSWIKRRLKFIKASLAALSEMFIIDLTCEYGTNWKRPVLLWSILVFLVFPVLYILVDGVKTGGGTPYLFRPVNSLWDYIYFSIITATTVGFGDMQPRGFGRVLASLEAVFGTFMWAVFITVIAKKYMR